MSDEPVVESFLGSLFDSSSDGGDSGGVDLKLDVADSDDSSGWWDEFSSAFDKIPAKAYYMIGAIVVLLIIIGLYFYNRKSQSSSYNDYYGYHGHPHGHHSIAYEDDLPAYPHQRQQAPQDALQQSAKDLPAIVEPEQKSASSFDPSGLIEIEKELTYSYSQLQQALQEQKPDPETLENWFDTMNNYFQKMAKEVQRHKKESSLTPETEQHLNRGMNDAMSILNEAKQKIEEKKRMMSIPESDQTSDVVKNMHFMGFANKIKQFSPKNGL